nr:hypothetical protein [Paracoccus saliphilus]
MLLLRRKFTYPYCSGFPNYLWLINFHGPRTLKGITLEHEGALAYMVGLARGGTAESPLGVELDGISPVKTA